MNGMYTVSNQEQQEPRYVDTQVFMDKNKSLGSLNTKDLLFAAILGITGGFISSLFPFSLLVKTWYPFVGGTQLVSGHHVLWMAICYGLVNKKQGILVTAFIKGACEWMLGDPYGFVILGVNLLEGATLALGFLLMERFKEGGTNLGWAIAGGMGNFPQAPFFWIFTGKIFVLHYSLAVLAFVFAFTSGCLLAGVLGRYISLKIRGSSFLFIHGPGLRTGESDIDVKSTTPEEHGGDVVRLEGLSFRFHGNQADIFHDVNLALEMGDFCLLVGPSGSGKTTLCNIMSGVIPWMNRGMYAGNTHIFGNNLLDQPPKMNMGIIGYSMQNPEAQIVTLTVRDELVFGVENMCLDIGDIERRLEAMIQLFDLKDLIDRRVTQLSGGEQQRVILASMLMMNPKFLILDEPLAFLDLHARTIFYKYMNDIKEKHGNEMIIAISEHRISKLAYLANKFININDGHVSIEMNPTSSQEIIKKPRHDDEAGIYEEILAKNGFTRACENDASASISTNTLISVHDLNFNHTQYIGKYRKEINEIFHDVTFSVNRGEFVGLLGKNGSGKTTLLYLLAGFFPSPPRAVRFEGKDIQEFKKNEYYRKIGFIFQNPETQIFKDRISDEILFGPRNFGLLDGIDKDQMQDYYELIKGSQENLIDKLVANKPFSGLNPFKLSWGQKRRLNIASLLVYSPDLYLLDEPFIGQDPHTRHEIIRMLEGECKRGKTVIIASHDDEIFTLCSKILLLKDGSLEMYKRKGIIEKENDGVAME
ncbi:MAG: ECF transporter S component [Promethearchaeota archaeon]